VQSPLARTPSSQNHPFRIHQNRRAHQDDDSHMEYYDSHVLVSPQNLNTRVGATRDSPIVVESDDMHVEHSNDPTSGSSSESSSQFKLESSKDRKRLRALRRMMPAFMIPEQLDNKKPPRWPRRSSTPDVEVDDKPLLPGQTRVRKRNHHETVDVRGDSESSGDGQDSDHFLDEHLEIGKRSDSGSEVEVHWQRHRRPVLTSEASMSSDETESNDDNIDDAKIGAWLADRSISAPSTSRKRDENLIDWMLSRTRTVGGNDKAQNTMRRRRPANLAPGPRRRGVDIIVREAGRYGHEQQTLLSFSKHHKSRPAHSRNDSCRRGASRAAKHPPNYDIQSHVHQVEERETDAFTSLKRKKKQLRNKVPGQVYTFTSAGTRITSGRQRDSFITVDLQDEGFHQALAGRDWVKTNTSARILPMANYINKAPSHCISETLDFRPATDHDIHPSPPASSPVEWITRHRDIKVDCDVPVLVSGISFCSDTYLGKFWLQELIKLVSGTENAHIPEAFESWDFRFTPTMFISDFSQALELVCDKLFELSAATQEDGISVFREWEAVMHAVCLHASWLTSDVNEEDSKAFDIAINEPLQRLVGRLEDLHVSASATRINFFKISVLWFAVEMTARIRSSLLKKGQEHLVSTTALRTYVLALVRCLHNYGLRPVVESIKENLLGGHDSLSMPQRAAELWICVFHLLDNANLTFEDDSEPRLSHSLWTVLWKMLKPGVRLASGLEASEDAWRTIFGLCAISQFSVHGLTTSECRLPASWEVAALALTHISVVADPEQDEGLPERALNKRDEYVRLVTARCFILWGRWHWHLDGDQIIFSNLYEIFKSRKFANLRQEHADLPNFLLKNDVQLLSQCKPSDTAFEIFLKLVAQADDRAEGPERLNQPLSVRFKKLLSLSTPKATIPFTKANPPTKHELSILYNILGAVGVAIRLDPSPESIQHRLAEARRCVNFKQADDNTRIACIRGIMHFAIILQHRRFHLRDVLIWLREITNILVDEYKEIDSVLSASAELGHTNVVKDRLVISIQVLLGSVRRIIEAPRMDHNMEYPEPSLLDGRALPPFSIFYT
jgi:hypothetical protein